jgi:GNAT superfamily N-acetyltransferase
MYAVGRRCGYYLWAGGVHVPITFKVLDDNGDLDVEARSAGVVIGYVRGERDGDRFRLLDFQVVEFAPRGTEFKAGTPLRGRGIGTELLNRFLQRVDASGVRETSGMVTPADVDETPHLLAIYEKHGFVVDEADMKIVRRR